MRAHVLVLTAAVSACGAGGTARHGAAPPDSTVAAVNAAPGDSLRIELIGPARARAGEAVSFTLRVTNGAARAVDLYLRGRAPTADLVVEREDGTAVWRRLEGEMIPAIGLLHALPAGGQLDVAVTWDQATRDGGPAPPGRYRIRGALLTETGQRETAAVPLEIVPR